MGKFNPKQFFAEIAAELHSSGAMQTYAKPKGVERGWSEFSKDAHEPELDFDNFDYEVEKTKPPHPKDKPGLVFHPGDEPYNVLTTGQAQYYKDIDISEDDIKLRMASVIKAIKAYFPEDKFSGYLQYFTENLHKREHQEALKRAYENIPEQLRHSERITDKKLHKLIAAKDPNEIRDGIGASEAALRALEKPELILSIAIYQAAHISYLKELSKAINASRSISEDEKENANAVMKAPFRQFKSSLLFLSMAPLTILAREEMPENSPPEDESMNKAISAAWRKFFEMNLLTRSYEENEIAPNKAGNKAEMTCPAVNLLRGAQAGKHLENTYQYVATHRKELATQLSDVTKIGQNIITNGPRSDIPGLEWSFDEEPPKPTFLHKLGISAMLAGASLLPGHDAPERKVEKPARKWVDVQERKTEGAPKRPDPFSHDR